MKSSQLFPTHFKCLVRFLSKNSSTVMSRESISPFIVTSTSKVVSKISSKIKIVNGIPFQIIFHLLSVFSILYFAKSHNCREYDPKLFVWMMKGPLARKFSWELFANVEASISRVSVISGPAGISVKINFSILSIFSLEEKCFLTCSLSILS